MLTAGDRVWVQGPDGDVALTAVPRFPESGHGEAVAGGLVAPMPGTVLAVHVAPGDTVAHGQLLMIVEAMKMEHRITAPRAGAVREVRARPGDQVNGGDLLAVLDDSPMSEPDSHRQLQRVLRGPAGRRAGDGRRRSHRRADRRLARRADHAGAGQEPAAGQRRPGTRGRSSPRWNRSWGQCLDRGIKVVSNAGGLTPDRCAEAVAAVAAKLGLHPVIGYVEGDNLVPRLAELRAAGADLANLDTGEPLGDRPVLTANAYLGGWGIAEALARGADIVITGRVTDAALALGPAAWHHGWRRDDWDALAGAVVAGHVIECGAQATGGNFAFFTEVPGLEHPGFPIAEVAADGSAVITKHPGHGGMVSVDTVTAQLLYEIGGPAYLNPDVTARFDSIAWPPTARTGCGSPGCAGTRRRPRPRSR